MTMFEALLLAACVLLATAWVRWRDRAIGERAYAQTLEALLAKALRSDALPSDFGQWPGDVQAAWPRHPVHQHRCYCRKYGTPGGAAIHDEWGLHQPERCQPESEVL
jgi:hypothetical protein